MPKSISARLTYRESNFTYAGALEATNILITKRNSHLQKDASLVVEIRGGKGFLRSVSLVIPASVAAALGGVLLSAAGDASKKSEVIL
jgi:hypothetical protein